MNFNWVLFGFFSLLMRLLRMEKVVGLGIDGRQNLHYFDFWKLTHQKLENTLLLGVRTAQNRKCWWTLFYYDFNMVTWFKIHGILRYI